MNKTIGIQLAIYSLLLLGASLLVYSLAPATTRPTLIVGLAGAGLCLVWAARAVIGKGGKSLPILTLTPVCYVLLGQAIVGWSGGELAAARCIWSALVTILFLLSLAMLTRIAYAGIILSGPGANPFQGPQAQSPEVTIKDGRHQPSK